MLPCFLGLWNSPEGHEVRLGQPGTFFRNYLRTLRVSAGFDFVDTFQLSIDELNIIPFSDILKSYFVHSFHQESSFLGLCEKTTTTTMVTAARTIASTTLHLSKGGSFRRCVGLCYMVARDSRLERYFLAPRLLQAYAALAETGSLFATCHPSPPTATSPVPMAPR